MKYTRKIGVLLIIIGTVLVIYKILIGRNFELTKSIGFISFILGLLLTGIDKVSTNRK